MMCCQNLLHFLSFSENAAGRRCWIQLVSSEFRCSVGDS